VSDAVQCAVVEQPFMSPCTDNDALFVPAGQERGDGQPLQIPKLKWDLAHLRL
jgi:hypothetical protein